LIVEINSSYRSVIGHVVELAGGEWESVSEIGPGRKLLAGSRKFDLVIIGVDAQSRVDPEVLIEMRALAPIIMLDETYNGALQTFEAGAEQILPKPFVPDALASGQSPVVFHRRRNPRPNMGNGGLDRTIEDVRHPNATQALTV